MSRARTLAGAIGFAIVLHPAVLTSKLLRAGLKLVGVDTTEPLDQPDARALRQVIARAARNRYSSACACGRSGTGRPRARGRTALALIVAQTFTM